MSLLLQPAYRSLADVPAGREIESRGLYVPLRGLDDALCKAGLPIGCILMLARLNSHWIETRQLRKNKEQLDPGNSFARISASSRSAAVIELSHTGLHKLVCSRVQKTLTSSSSSMTAGPVQGWCGSRSDVRHKPAPTESCASSDLRSSKAARLLPHTAHGSSCQGRALSLHSSSRHEIEQQRHQQQQPVHSVAWIPHTGSE